jgi:hypothetical protein
MKRAADDRAPAEDATPIFCSYDPSSGGSAALRSEPQKGKNIMRDFKMIIAVLALSGCASPNTPSAPAASDAADEQWVGQALRTGGNAQTCLAGQVKFLFKVKGSALYAFSPRISNTSSYNSEPSAIVPLTTDGSANEVVRLRNGDSGRVIVPPGKGPRHVDLNTMSQNCSYRFSPV